MIVPQTLFFHHHLSREYIYERKEYGIRCNGFVPKGALLALDRSLSANKMHCLVDFIHLNGHTEYVREMPPCNLRSPPNIHNAHIKAKMNVFVDGQRMSLVDKIHQIHRKCQSNACYHHVLHDDITYFRVDALQDISPGDEITVPPLSQAFEKCICDPLDHLLEGISWKACRDYDEKARSYIAELEKKRPLSYFIDSLDHRIAHFLQTLMQHNIYIINDQLRGNGEAAMHAAIIFKNAQSDLDKKFNHVIINRRLATYYPYFLHYPLIEEL